MSLIYDFLKSTFVDCICEMDLIFKLFFPPFLVFHYFGNIFANTVVEIRHMRCLHIHYELYFSYLMRQRFCELRSVKNNFILLCLFMKKILICCY